jgi:hypothetical protein
MPERANIQVDFSGGPDQGTDARHVVPGRLTSLLNGTFEKSGSIRKRRGFTALARATLAGGALAACVRLATFGSELVLSDGDGLYSYSAQALKWSYRDQLPQPVATRAPVAHGSTSFQSPDVAYGNGYLVTAWNQNYNASTGYSDLRVSVIDVATGAQVMSAVGIGSTQAQLYARVVVIDTTAYVIYGTSAGHLDCAAIDLTNPTSIGAPTTLASDLKATAQAAYDAGKIAGYGTLAVAYVNSGGIGTAKLEVRTFLPNAGALVPQAARTLGLISDPTYWMMSLNGDGATEGLWVAHGRFVGGAFTVTAMRLDATTLVDNVAPFLVATDSSLASGFHVGIARVSSTQAVVTWTEQASADNVRTATWKLVNTSGAVVGSTPSFLRRHFFLSKPFVQGGRAFALACYAQDVFSSSATAYVVDLDLATIVAETTTTCGRPVATLAPRRTSTSPVSDIPANLCSVAPLGASAWATGTVVRKAANGKLGLDWTKLDFAAATRHTGRELGSSLHLSGGVPCIYDGARVTENAALIAPEEPFGFSQVASGGSIAAGDYSYCITFCRYDMQGQRQRSAPSVGHPYTVTGAGSTVTFSVVPLHMTLVQDAESGFEPAWYIEVWRTTAGGATFFKVLESYLTYSGGTAAPVLNDPTASEIVISDTIGDGVLDAQEILYTTGGVQENRCPPSASILAVHKDRAWLAGTDDPKVVWFSQPYTFGEVPGFHDDNTILVEEGGPITALASLDAHLVIFKRDRIFYVDGDGPGNTGGPGFSAPQRIAVDLGCIEPRSVAVVPDGVVFQSTAGIYLLDRGLQVSYLSGPVVDTLAANPTVTSAVVHESQFEIRFTCNSAGATGVSLVYNYLVKQWSVFQLYDATAAQASTAIAASVNHGGVYMWAAANGTVYGEDAASYLDAGTWVAEQVETAWIKVGGLQGWVRAWAVQLLAERFSAHDLTVEIATDYAPTYTQVKLWRDGAIAAMPLEQVRTAIVHQKCQAIRFRITDAAPTDADGNAEALGTGQGMALTGLLLEAGVLRKAKRLSAAQRW